MRFSKGYASRFMGMQIYDSQDARFWLEGLTSFGNRFGLARLMSELSLYLCDCQHNVHGHDL